MGRCLEHYWRDLPVRILGAASVAALIALLPEAVWAPIDNFAQMFAAWAQPQDPTDQPQLAKALKRTAIVKIDALRFQAAYKGKSPLNRCQLARDIQTLLSLPKLRTLGVDFDLSPTTDPEDAPCQAQLDALLAQQAKADRLVLMLPQTDGEFGPLKDAIESWTHRFKAKRIPFGHVNLKPIGGVVRKYLPEYKAEEQHESQLAFGSILGQRIRGAASAEEIYSGMTEPAEEREISIRASELLANEGLALNVCLDQPAAAPCQELETIVFGSGYTSDDVHATVAGPRDGVDIHAAILACPHLEASPGRAHLRAYVAEILISALLFAPFLEFFWLCYFEAASGRQLLSLRAIHETAACPWQERLKAILPRQPSAAYLWLLLGSLCVLLLIPAHHLLELTLPGDGCTGSTHIGSMFLGMCLEGALVKNTEVATHQLRHLQSALERQDRSRTSEFRPLHAIDGYKVAFLMGLFALQVAAIAFRVLHFLPLGD